MQTKPGLLTIALAGAALAACGGSNNAAPTLIPGGGVGSGSIDGLVNVYVIDQDTEAPIANAKVRVGTIDGTTDATGLFAAKDGALSGPQDVTAVADGHVATMWVGVDGANVTVPVAVTGTSTPTVAHAELDGDLTGYDQLVPATSQDALYIAVMYSQTPDFGAPENSLQQPAGQISGLDGNICVKSSIASTQCGWKVASRTGRVALLATIMNRDLNGTPTDPSDDIVTVTGYAALTSVTVNDGANQTGLALTQLAAGDTESGGIDFGTPPAALDQVQGLMLVDLGEDGLAPVANVLTPAAHTMLVPSPSAFAGSTYRAIAIANKSTGGDAQSLILTRGLTDPSSVAVGDWLPTPTGLSVSGDAISFAAVTGAVVQGADIEDSTGAVAWTVTAFDGSLAATVPTDLAPIPTGSDTLRGTAIDADLDVTDFNLEHKFDVVNRLSADAVTFTR
jgi:hypothetical protein